MLQTLKNAWRVEEIRKKILFTLIILLIYRVGNAIPVPYVNTDALQTYFTSLQNTVLGLLNVMSGGAFSQATIFALSIQPYINASIIIQLLCIAIPALERMSKDEGEEGKKKIASITRYSTVAIGLLQGFAYFMLIKNNGLLVAEARSSVWAAIVIILTFTSGSALIMWLGEQITEHGIGNGISMILFAGIISRFPTSIASTISNVVTGNLKWWVAVLMYLGALAIIILIVFVNDAERRVPVQYAKRVVGRKMYGGQSTHIPMKVNQAGVIPIIFSISLLQFPLTITYFCPNSGFADIMSKYLSPSGNPGVWVYSILNILLTLFFTYFYTAITFKVDEVADNMRQSGGFVPGIRPGVATVEYLSKIMSRLCLAGGIFLAAVATIPTIVSVFTPFNFSFGGTSLLIMVGVALDTVQQLENQMLMRNYQGFLK